jgi:Cu/Ag efflux protein CusF
MKQKIRAAALGMAAFTAVLAAGLAPGIAEDMKMPAGQSAPTADGLYWGHGKVKAVNSQKGTVTIAHEPIKALMWPSMVMTFKVADPALLANMSAGTPVDFALKETGKEQYDVVDLKKAAK